MTPFTNPFTVYFIPLVISLNWRILVKIKHGNIVALNHFEVPSETVKSLLSQPKCNCFYKAGGTVKTLRIELFLLLKIKLVVFGPAKNCHSLALTDM